MLFDPDRHETLSAVAWDEARARQTIQDMVLDIEAQRSPQGDWALHPLDNEGDEPAGGFKNLYLGTAGVWWALWYLQREGAVKLTMDPSDAAGRLHTDADLGPLPPSYFLGQAGVWLVQWRLTGSALAADKLHAVVQSNIHNPTNESLWAAPGTMLAAWHMWTFTGQTRWRDLYLENVDQVWRTWLFDAAAQCHLWTQDMYGKVVQYLGAGHGFAGNAYALLKGAALLDETRRHALFERCVVTLRATADWEGDAVNWRPGTYTPRPGGPRFLMQWCHGAPGIVTAMANYPPKLSAEMDAMLVGAGQAVWQAGPLGKGHGLCHGTAGNGYAFLQLYQRTGDALWLHRARAFAVHAIDQQQRMRQQHGQGRFTLWTGDVGLAIYLWHCVQGRAGLPGLDIIQ